MAKGSRVSAIPVGGVRSGSPSANRPPHSAPTRPNTIPPETASHGSTGSVPGRLNSRHTCWVNGTRASSHPHRVATVPSGLGSGAMTDYGHDLLFGSFITPDAARPDRAVTLALLSEELGLDLVTVQDHPY